MSNPKHSIHKILGDNDGPCKIMHTCDLTINGKPVQVDDEGVIRIRLEMPPPRRVQIAMEHYVLVDEIAELYTCSLSGSSSKTWITLSGHPDGEEREVARCYVGGVYDVMGLDRPEGLDDE